MASPLLSAYGQLLLYVATAAACQHSSDITVSTLLYPSLLLLFVYNMNRLCESKGLSSGVLKER